MHLPTKIRMVAMSTVILLLLAGGAFAVYQNVINVDGNGQDGASSVKTTVTWKTPLEDTKGGKVEYGETTDYGSLVVENITEPSPDHSVILTGLAPKTTYHYKIILENDKASDDQTFETGECGGDGNCNDDGDTNSDEITCEDVAVTSGPVDLRPSPDSVPEWGFHYSCCQNGVSMGGGGAYRINTESEIFASNWYIEHKLSRYHDYCIPRNVFLTIVNDIIW